MEINRTKNSIRNTYSGIINRCVNLLIPFIIRTIIIKKLGSEYLGLSSLFTSIIQVLNLTELGVGNALVFSMYKPIAEDKKEELQSLLELYKKTYRAIGIIILIVGGIITPFLPFIIDMDALNGTEINVYALFIIYLFNSVGTYWFFAYKKSILIAHQRQDIVSKVDSVIHLIMYGAQIVVLYLVPNYYLYIILLPIFTLIDNGVSAYSANKIFPYIRNNKHVEAASIKPIIANIKYLIGHKIGAVIISSADSIVISAFLSMTTLTTYSNYFYVISALNGFINVGYNAVLAGVGNSVVKESKDKVYYLFKDLSFLLFYMVSFCTICLFCLFQPFMQLWMGCEYMFPLTTVVLFAVYFYTWQIRVMGLNFKDASGMWKNDALKPYVGMVINVLLNIVLVQFIGVNGVLLATITVMTIVYFPWETKVLFRDLFETSCFSYVIRQILYFVITLLSTAVVYFMTSFLKPDSIGAFILKTAITAIFAFILLIIWCFKMKEFKNTINRLKRVIKR